MKQPKFIQHPNLHEALRYGMIGLIAASVHFLALVGIVELVKMPPIFANIFAYYTGFIASFTGHQFYTFRRTGVRIRHALLRFLIVTTFTFGLNQGFYYLLLKFTHLHYATSIIIVLLIVPPTSYFLSKLWAFKHHAKH